MTLNRSGFTANRLQASPQATVALEWSSPSTVVKVCWVVCILSDDEAHAIQIDGSPNSFTNFKNSALAIGASLSSAAPASTAAGSGSATAAYGGVTIAPAPTPSEVTQAVTVASSTWTTVYSSYPNSPAPTPASLQGNVIKVVVGGPGKLLFDPPHVSAQPRDTIMFQL